MPTVEIMFSNVTNSFTIDKTWNSIPTDTLSLVSLHNAHVYILILNILLKQHDNRNHLHIKMHQFMSYIQECQFNMSVL